MQALVDGLTEPRDQVIIIGDTKSPADFDLPGARFLGVEAQHATGLSSALHCPIRHYARKNVGYLLAIRDGAPLIQETDDDNLPIDGFFAPATRTITAPIVRQAGWINVYRYFADGAIWPRGLPLDQIHGALPDFETLSVETLDCPIQQGLANGNPDVDAIFRLVSPRDVTFQPDRRVALGRGNWCPFNSQNTLWFPDAFPLLYLPAHCSFRMTDIWRGFVAQRIAWENGWSLLFHHATVWQDRNPHNLMRDFEDEIPGYMNNARIAAALEDLQLTGGPAAMADNLIRCYQALIDLGVVGEAETPLLKCWLTDLGL